VSRADLTFFVIFAAICLVGVMVVIRLLRSDEPRLADPSAGASAPGQAGSDAGSVT